jgi:hypothetical protein
MEEKYSPLFGIRIKCFRTYELVGVNDLGVPYFSEVVKGKIQKKRYTIWSFDRGWLDEQIEEMKK